MEAADRSRLMRAQADALEAQATATRGGAASSRSLPTEVDLRAAYCIGVLKSEDADYRTSMPLIEKERERARGTSDEKLMVGVVERLTAEHEADERRWAKLRAYLEPRIPRLANEGIIAAIKSGSADHKAQFTSGETRACGDRCMRTPQGEEAASCVRTCLDESELGARLAQCRVTTFLPY